MESCAIPANPRYATIDIEGYKRRGSLLTHPSLKLTRKHFLPRHDLSFGSRATQRQELLNVKSLTRPTDGTFRTAWTELFPDGSHCCKQGGYIYVDFPIPALITKVYVTRAPKGTTLNQHPGPDTTGRNSRNPSIDLNNPGTRENRVILVANFHTHPLSDRAGGDPEPSSADKRNAYERGIPGIVISRRGIYSYGPERRENTTNPKEYPGTVTAPAIPNARLEIPRPAAKQWLSN